jgi:solute carrier family 35, member F1/2
MGLCGFNVTKVNILPRWASFERSKSRRRLLISTSLGQFLSLVIISTGICTTFLVQNGFSAPNTQIFGVYMSLALTYGPLLLYRFIKNEWKPPISSMHHRWLLKYFFIAWADVEANFVVVLAFQYTSIVSVMLLDCFSIPCVMFLSRMFLGRRFSWKHVLASTWSVAGLLLLVLSDTQSSGGGTGHRKDPLIGDLLCIAGAIFYAISNVSQEGVVKRYDRCEYLTMMGVFGSFISGIQAVVLEWKTIKSSVSVTDESVFGFWVPLFGFLAAMYIMYSLAPMLIQRTSAAFLNLSLLTSDAWALLAALFLFGIQLTPLFYVAFIMVMSGVLVFNIIAPPQSIEGQSQYHPIDDD